MQFIILWGIICTVCYNWSDDCKFSLELFFEDCDKAVFYTPLHVHNQIVFIPGKQIIDNVLMAFETLHHMKNKRQRKIGNMVLNLDMNKAYDRVK